jgi:hypothetical protein
MRRVFTAALVVATLALTVTAHEDQPPFFPHGELLQRTRHGHRNNQHKDSVEPLSVTLSVTAPSPFLHHVVATLNWTITAGQFDPALDWVSVWWEPFKATYVEFRNVTANSGMAEFTLLNARYPYEFRYYRNNTLIATADTNVAPDPTYPTGVHVIPVPNDHTKMVVMWTSNRSLGSNSIVQIGTSPDDLSTTVPSSRSSTYTQLEINTKVELPPIPIVTQPFENLGARNLRCGWGTCYNDFTASELFVDPGVFNIAEVSGLTPGQHYYYRVGEANGHISGVRRFRAMQAPSPTANLSVIYFADAGAGFTSRSFSGSASHNAVPVAPADSPEGAVHVWDAAKADPLTPNDDLAIMNGDISYARGWPFVWELFANETEDIFGVVPVLASIGNHEYDYAHNPFTPCNGPDSGGEAGIPTFRRFNFRDENKPWYWVVDGPAAIFALSSEHDPIAQHVWLRQELPKVNRSQTPWLIVFLHRPLYQSNDWASSVQSELVYEYAQIFNSFGVDFVLTGHSHYYERMCQISEGRCNTWGYRDAWTAYSNTALSLNPAVESECSRPLPDKMTELDCKAACALAGGCTGVLFDSYWKYPDQKKSCTLLNCTQPYPLYYNYSTTVWSMDRLPGSSPVYILDGTAGGVFAPVSTPTSPLTEYKDFESWGYSRLVINGQEGSATWNHYHAATGAIVDSVTLRK